MKSFAFPTARLGLIVACSCASLLRAQAPATTTARQEIAAVNARVVRAYNAGDVAAFSRVFTPDAAIMPAGTPTVRGQPAIAKFWQAGWDAGMRNLKLTSTEVDVQGDRATEVGLYEVDMKPAKGPTLHEQGKYIVLWKRNAKGEWQWHRDIFNTDAEPAPAPSAKR
jgi:uncharacterized protein (TIGR02246 family)